MDSLDPPVFSKLQIRIICQTNTQENLLHISAQESRPSADECLLADVPP